jgi:diguanylate cyclase (GGDEF)-like protein
VDNLERQELAMLEKKKKLVLLISLILVTGFLMTTFASYYVSRASLLSRIDESELPLTSDNIYSKIQHDLLQPIFISSLMANDTFLRDWVVQGEKDPVQMTRYLKEIQTKYNTYTCFFVSEQTKTYYQSEGILKKISSDDRRDDWYFRVREMKPDYEINVDPDMANNDTMTIFINYKVFDYDRNMIGATGVGLTVSAVKDLIEVYQKTFSRRIYFVDKQGEVKLHGASYSPDQANIHKVEGLGLIASEIVSGAMGRYRYERDGKRIHLNTRYIPEFQWYLLVEQTEKDAIENIFNALVLNLMICAVVVSVVLLLIYKTISGYQKRLEKVATVDKLTGVFNRLAFELIFEQALNEARRTDAPLSILLFDIDRFKQINDNQGHLKGDEVLKQVADLVAGQIRQSDSLARWGGDEFVILLRGCELNAAVVTAEKVRLIIEKVMSSQAITVSFGVAVCRPDESADSFLARADKALYIAKNSGRNCVKDETCLAE